jgi:hypothetical protein
MTFKHYMALQEQKKILEEKKKKKKKKRKKTSKHYGWSYIGYGYPGVHDSIDGADGGEAGI